MWNCMKPWLLRCSSKHMYCRCGSWASTPHCNSYIMVPSEICSDYGAEDGPLMTHHCLLWEEEHNDTAVGDPFQNQSFLSCYGTDPHSLQAHIIGSSDFVNTAGAVFRGALSGCHTVNDYLGEKLYQGTLSLSLHLKFVEIWRKAVK